MLPFELLTTTTYLPAELTVVPDKVSVALFAPGMLTPSFCH